MTTARPQRRQLKLYTATIAALLATGCSSISSILRPARSQATFLPAAPAPVAQADGAAANAPAAVESVEPTATAEPIKVPVINMFGELDGRQSSSQPQSSDFGFQQHT